MYFISHYGLFSGMHYSIFKMTYMYSQCPRIILFWGTWYRVLLFSLSCFVIGVFSCDIGLVRPVNRRNMFCIIQNWIICLAQVGLSFQARYYFQPGTCDIGIVHLFTRLQGYLPRLCLDSFWWRIIKLGGHDWTSDYLFQSLPSVVFHHKPNILSLGWSENECFILC